MGVMKTRPRVLIVDDDPPFCELLKLSLSAKGFAATARTSAEDGLTALSSREFDAVLTDLQLPRMDGLELCRRVAEARPNVPVVVVTAYGNQEAAIAALRAGAHDFITKPVQIDEVGQVLERATLPNAGGANTPVPAERALVAPPQSVEGILGESPAIERLRALLSRAASSDASVLVTGESGTGKELVARALHGASRRAGGRFVAMNCAAVPETLLESELFGHVRGAFTDARVAKQGLVAQADGGTLFLDEIGDLSPILQPKLLRALQERTIRPVGSVAEVPVDVRIVAATNDDIDAAVAARRFRSDLYYRLNVIRVAVPPLRERGDDVILLARHFITAYSLKHDKHVSGLTREAETRLRAYSWPGNVRELQNCIERAVALTESGEIDLDDLSETVAGSTPSPVRPPDDALLPLAEVEHRHILRVLEAVGGNKLLAARILGIDRRTLYRRLEQRLGP